MTIRKKNARKPNDYRRGYTNGIQAAVDALIDDFDEQQLIEYDEDEGRATQCKGCLLRSQGYEALADRWEFALGIERHLGPDGALAIEGAVDGRDTGPILRSRRGSRMDRHCATRRLRRLATIADVQLQRMHPHMLRHTFVTTMLDAGVDLRDVQIAARHADPRTTMRYDRARNNLDRHPNYILAAYMASGT